MTQQWFGRKQQVVLGAAIYIAGSVIFKLDSFNYLLSIFKKLLRRRAQGDA